MNILFPHQKIRPIQDLFIKDIQSALEENKHLLAHAPTGLGKTAAILSVALPYAIENNKTVFFLTSKHTQHKIVLDTIEKIKEKFNINITVADFIGKKWMCLIPNITSLTANEFYDYCKELIEKKHCYFYTNVKNKNKLSILTQITLQELNKKSNVEEVIKICEQNKLCPYEITCLLAKNSNLVIADYYHILNPSIRQNLFNKIEKDLSDCILIFDEAHSLPNRIRDLLTINLSTFIIDNAIKEIKSLNKETSDDLKQINKILEKLTKKSKIQETEILISKEDLVNEINKIINYDELIANLRFLAEQILEIKKRSFCNSIANFLEAWLGQDECFTRILTKSFRKNKPFINITYQCLDPSLISKPLSEKSLIIAMSGTLTPLTMYKDLLDINAILKQYDDPFPKENRLNLIIPLTTTKFTKRDLSMYKRIAILCANLTKLIPGNIAIFFPSYQIMQDINVYFEKLCKKIIFLEQQGSSKEDKEIILENFKKNKNIGAVLLATSSGSFGEGIDLRGDFLKAVIIVGLPLAKPNLETKELINYYDLRFNKGWDYAYIYPAIIKCLQNAGRCIRSSKDKGIIIFIDERYVWQNYFKLFPKHWDIKITRNPEIQIKNFLN